MWSHIGVEMELTRRVSVNVTVQARDAEAWLGTLAVVGGIKLFLRERRNEHPQAVKLDGSQKVLEQAIEVIDRNHLAARHIVRLVKWNGLSKISKDAKP